MATQHNFRVKNGLEVAGVQRISSTGVITGTLDSNTTATTQSALDNSTKIATTAYTDAAITAVIGGAPGTLDTLNELAAAINDDASYATTLTTALATKLPLTGGTLTGALTVNAAGGVYVKGGGGLRLEPTDAHDTDAWILYQYTDNTLRYNFTGAGADEIIIKHPASANTTTLTVDTANVSVGIGKASPLAGALDVSGKLNVLSGSSALRFEEYNNGATIWLDGSDGDFSGADYWNISANGTTDLRFGYSTAAQLRILASGNVGIGGSPQVANKLEVVGKGYFGPVGAVHGDTKANMQTNAVLQLKPHNSNSTNMTFASVNGGAGMGIQVSNGPQTANWDIALNPYGGGVAIGGTSVLSGVKLEVNGGKIYVPGHTIQAQTALIGGFTNYKWKEQPLNNSATAPSANRSAAFIGSNGSTTGVVLQRDSIGNTFPDFAITENGYVYVGGNITMQNGGQDSADYRSGAPGYVNWGSKIENHNWKNWSGTGNYTARLYTPIVHNESNMFQLEIDVYGYSTGGSAQRYIGGGYAYSGSSLISHGTVALSGNLTHRLTTATHPNFNSTVVCFDIGYSNNNGTAYYNHMRWRYQGWNGKRSEDFVWAAVTT